MLEWIHGYGIPRAYWKDGSWVQIQPECHLIFSLFHMFLILTSMGTNGCQDSELQTLTQCPVERTDGLLIFQLHDSWRKARGEGGKNRDDKTLN